MIKLVDELRELSASINTMLELYNQYSEPPSKIESVHRLLSGKQAELFKKSWTGKQAMAKLGISQPTLIKRRKLGLIPYLKVGSKYYYFRPVKSNRMKGAHHG